MNDMKLLITMILLCLTSIYTYGQTNAEIGAPFKKKFDKADKNLNNIYQQILKKYSDDSAFISKLKTSERLWLKMRNADFEMMFPYADSAQNYYGSIYPVCYLNTMTELTNDRINWLEKWIEGTEEGDVCSGSLKYKEKK